MIGAMLASPFLLFGFLFVVLGLFGTIRYDGQIVHGQDALLGRCLFVLTGSVSLLFGWLLQHYL